jgi:hypothetical protein
VSLPVETIPVRQSSRRYCHCLYTFRQQQSQSQLDDVINVRAILTLLAGAEQKPIPSNSIDYQPNSQFIEDLYETRQARST